MLAASDKSKNALARYFVDSDGILALPVFSRASISVVAIIVVFLLVICALTSLALLIRLGFDAWTLPGVSYQESAKNFLFAFVGVFGAPFLAWRTWVAHQQANAAMNQASVALENHITSIFSKSVELLGQVREVKSIASDGSSAIRSAPNTEARLGALFSLERLLNESEKDQRAIFETLCAYVRENSPFECDDDELSGFLQGRLTPKPTRRSDVQAAITILGRRPMQVRQRSRDENWLLDLRNANLVGYDFSGLNFDHSDFSNSFLNFAKLNKASFANSMFENTVLRGSNLTGTSFQFSQFKHCNVDKAAIDATSFKGAKIKDTDLRDANVLSLDISGADLTNAFDSFLQYTINRIKQTGAAGPYDGQEILKTAAFFDKAAHDDQTEVSQAMAEAIELVKVGRASAALPAPAD